MNDRLIGSLSREECVKLLEGVCIQCYDHETLATLQEAVKANVEDGTIEYGDLISFTDRQ